MTCTACGDNPKMDREFPSAVVEINNPEQLVLLRKVVIPATMTEEDNPPVIGKYRNVILQYENTGNVYLYSSDGIPTAIESNVPQEILGRIEDLESEDAVLHGEIDSLADDLAGESQARTEADNALGLRLGTVETDLAAEVLNRTNADTSLGNRITAIEDKIPAQASAQNQLADKNFVNSSVATNTANYISNNGQPFNSLAELEAYTGTLTNNDYAFVVGTDQVGNTTYTRYKYVASAGEWAEEYVLNNSSFTAVQWAAINSNITSGAVDKLSNLADIQSVGANLSLVNGELSATDTTYTAGAGLSLNGTQFSADTSVLATQNDLTTGLATKQNNLTAGANIQINNDTISATDTTYSPFTGTDGTAAGTVGLVPAPAITDAGKVLGANGSWVTGGPTVVQNRGNSTTDVMSQNATTAMIYPSYPNHPDRIRIGESASSSDYGTVALGNEATATNNSALSIGARARAYGNSSIAIGGSYSGQGTMPVASSNYGIAIGYTARAGRGLTGEQADYAVALGASSSVGTAGDARYSVALGAYSLATKKGQVDISTLTAGTSNTYGYNESAYRLLTGLYDPQNDHDAATKGYVDNSIPATFTTNEWNALWA